MGGFNPAPNLDVAVLADETGTVTYRYQFQYAVAHAVQADEQALRLLNRFLSPEQRRSFDCADYFDVVSQHGRLYRLYRRRCTGFQNVTQLRVDGRLPDGSERLMRVCDYCIHIYCVPRAAELLAFKLMLELNEDLFLATANPTHF